MMKIDASSEVRIVLTLTDPGAADPDISPKVELDTRAIGIERETGDMAWLKTELARLARNERIRTEVPFIINADRECAYQWVILALNACRLADLKIVNFAAPDHKESTESSHPETIAASGAPAPDAGQLAEADHTERLVIDVDRDNTIWIGGRKRTLEEVEQFIRAEKRLHGEEPSDSARRPVLIEAARHAKWGTVHDIISIANRLNFWLLSFSTKRDSETPGN